MVFEPELSIIIPAYNEQENIPQVLDILNEKLPNWVGSHEILVVDDGSIDNTAAVVQAFSNKDTRIRLIRHSQNRGPGSGIKTGLSNARGRLVTFIPADMAINIDQFPKYLRASDQADVIVGIRSDRSDYSIMRKMNSLVYIWLIKLLFQMKQRQFNYVHLYRRAIFDKFQIWSEGVFITAEIMIRARDQGLKLKEVEIDYVPRTRGKASCGHPSIIVKTFADLALFWSLWMMNKHERLTRRQKTEMRAG